MMEKHITKGLYAWLFWGLSVTVSVATAGFVMPADELIRLYGVSIEAEAGQGATRGLKLSANQSGRGIAGVRKSGASAQQQLASKNIPTTGRWIDPIICRQVRRYV